MLISTTSEQQSQSCISWRSVAPRKSSVISPPACTHFRARRYYMSTGTPRREISVTIYFFIHISMRRYLIECTYARKLWKKSELLCLRILIYYTSVMLDTNIYLKQNKNTFELLKWRPNIIFSVDK